MDPNANLKEHREILTRIRALEARTGNLLNVRIDDVRRLVELSEALDEWLSRGGAKPNDWANNKKFKKTPAV